MILVLQQQLHLVASRNSSSATGRSWGGVKNYLNDELSSLLECIHRVLPTVVKLWITLLMWPVCWGDLSKDFSSYKFIALELSCSVNFN